MNTTSSGASDIDRARELLLNNLERIDHVTRSVCKRRGLSPDEVQDVVGQVRLRLIENDYAVLRHYRYRSSLATYVATLVRHWLADDHVRTHGKWHASAEAERLGPIAVALERMLHREDATLDDALLTLQTMEPELTRDGLARIAEQLPPRWPRPRSVPLEHAYEGAVAVPHHDVEPDHDRTVAYVASQVRQAIERFAADDQLILQFMFVHEMPVASIARALHLEQKPLYRRLQRLLRDLRVQLERAGIHSDDVMGLVAEEGVFDFGLRTGGRPSEEVAELADEDKDDADASAPWRESHPRDRM